MLAFTSLVLLAMPWASDAVIPEAKWRRRAMGAKPIDYSHLGGHPFERIKQQNRRRLQHEDLGDDWQHEPVKIPAEAKFDTNYFRPIRILFKYDHMPSSANTQHHVTLLKETVMPQVVDFWAKTLSVFPVKRLYVDSESCTLSDPQDYVYGVAGTDLLIQVVNNEKFCSGNTLAAANSCDWDDYDRPIGGLISFCFSNIEIRNTEGHVSTSTIRKVVSAAIHEVAHILGFHENDFAYFYDSETGEPRTKRPIPQDVSHKCITGKTESFDMPSETTVRQGETDSGIQYFELVTPKVVQVAQNHFNCPTLTGVRLENQDTGDACIGTHFEERLYFTESMSAIATSSSIPSYLSPLTLALFEDSGWYQANFTNVSISPFGHGRGCDFVKEPCITNGNIPAYSKGVFCNKLSQTDYMCDSSHSIISHCDLIDYVFWPDLTPPPESYRYFDKPSWGGKILQADYCPTWSVYVTDCKGPALKDELLFPGEIFSAKSRCVNSNAGRPLCMEAVCNSQSYTIDISFEGSTLQCHYEDEGKQLSLDDSGVIIFCPKFAEFCPESVPQLLSQFNSCIK